MSGIAARDYSELAKKENLIPVELNLQKLEDMISYLIREFSTINSHELKQISLNDVISYKVMFFSIAFIIGMCVISFLEILYIKKYFQSRKII